MTKLRAYLISTCLDQIQDLKGDSPSKFLSPLAFSDNLFDSIIQSNFERVFRIACLHPSHTSADALASSPSSDPLTLHDPYFQLF
jgi:hypothetical protein